jgi:hypothetical protein
MRRGRFEAAWRVSDALMAARGGTPQWHLPRHVQAVWKGEPVEGRRVLVRCYHGLGDTLHFIRFVPLLRRVAREVTVWVQPELIPLLRGTGGFGRLLPLHEGTPEAEYDVDVELMELPHLFRTTPETIPAEVPYLEVEPAPRPDRARLAVGLVWRTGEWQPERSVPPELLRPLGDVGGVELHVLQRGAGLAERPAELGVLSGSDDVLRAARVMRSLDLVISVDSMPAHLAGALGVPVWLLLRARADWRWMEEREDSPWYPTMRLFRQRREGEWGEVVDRVGRELRRMARSAANG